MKKKFITIFLFCLVVFGVFTVSANAASITASGTCGAGRDGKHLSWTLDDAGTLTISGTGAMADYTNDSPSIRDGVYYAPPRAPWYDKRFEIKGLRIDSGVTYIGSYAFNGLSSVKTVTVPDSVTNIGPAAFWECSELESITLPFIGSGSYASPRSRFGHLFGAQGTYTIIPKSLKTVTLSAACGYLGENAFYGCTSIRSLIFEGNAPAVVDRSAFSGNLTGDSAPTFIIYAPKDNATWTTDSAYDAMTSTWHGHPISFDRGLLGSGICGAGTDGKNLSWTLDERGRLTISGTGKMVSSQKGGAPWERIKTNVKTVVIGDGVTSIGSYAFYGCKNMMLVTIPESVTSVDDGAFLSCQKFTDVNYGGGEANWTQIAVGTNNAPLTDASVRYDYVPGVGSISGDCGADPDGKNLCWTFDESGTLAISGTGEMKRYRETDVPWYKYADDITALEIGDGVTSISPYAFDECIGLTEVTIPSSVTSIGAYAFKGCTEIESLTLPFIGGGKTGEPTLGYLFNGSNYDITASLRRVVILDGCTSIGDEAFSYRGRNLESVTIPDSVTSIGDAAFRGCIGLTDITIPNSVFSIGNSAFSSCDGLTSITIPDSVIYLGERTFCYCDNLTSIRLSNRIRDIRTWTFAECPALASITIPNSVTSIGVSAFLNCPALKRVTIGSGVKSIGSSAFSGCSSLTDVYYAGSAADWKKISVGPKNDPLLKAAIHYNQGPEDPEDTSGFCVAGNVDTSLTWVLGNDGTLMIAGRGAIRGYSTGSPAPWSDYAGRITAVVLSEGVTGIGNYAFSGCTALANVTLPNSLISICDYAFCGCTALESITIPDRVTNIGEDAFNSCTALESITIPDSVTSIGTRAFYNCTGLERVMLGSGVRSIDEDVFSGCTALGGVKIPDYMFIPAGATAYAALYTAQGQMLTVTKASVMKDGTAWAFVPASVYSEMKTAKLFILQNGTMIPTDRYRTVSK